MESSSLSPGVQQRATFSSLVPDQCSLRLSILFLTIYFDIILPSALRFSKLSLSLALIFPTKTLYPPFLSHTRALCPAHFSTLDFITRIIFGAKYKPSSSSLCSFLYSPETETLKKGHNFNNKVMFTPPIKQDT